MKASSLASPASILERVRNRTVLEWGGVGAGILLICFGVGAVVLSVNGKHTVTSGLKAERIVGTSNMSPQIAAKDVANLGLNGIAIPSCDVAGRTIDTAGEARCFARHMRVHVLESTGGKTYSELPVYASKDGNGTNDAALALKGPTGQPLDNPSRTLWVTETALTTALNSAYMADQLASFGLVVGIALVLAGVGFAIVALKGLERRSGERRPSSSA